MNDMILPQRLPVWILLAPVSPTLLVGILYALHFLGIIPWYWDEVTMGIIWLFSTGPIALMVLGIRMIDKRWRPGPDPAIDKALEALEEAAKTVNQAHKALKSRDTSEESGDTGG